MKTIAATCSRLVHSRGFHAAVITLIIASAVLMGLETSHTLMARYPDLFHTLNNVIQTLFVLELSLRFLSYAPNFPRFFKDGWNVFDFLVVAISFLPAAGPSATVARLARVLRITRLVSYSPELRLIIGTMLRSIPSMGHVIMLLGILLYIYGIVGFHLFQTADPESWGTLGRCMLSLFEMLTLEGWVEMQNRLLPTFPYAWLFFTSFVVIAVFVVVNLFIAVVINNLDTVKKEYAAEGDSPTQKDIQGLIASIRTQLDTLEKLSLK
jgi:voltage-gated sodium channel